MGHVRATTGHHGGVFSNSVLDNLIASLTKVQRVIGYGNSERERLRGSAKVSLPERARCKSCSTPVRVVGILSKRSLHVTALIRLCQTSPNNPVRRTYTVVDGMIETVIYWTGQPLVLASANADVPGRIQAEICADGRSNDSCRAAFMSKKHEGDALFFSMPIDIFLEVLHAKSGCDSHSDRGIAGGVASHARLCSASRPAGASTRLDNSRRRQSAGRGYDRRARVPTSPSAGDRCWRSELPTQRRLQTRRVRQSRARLVPQRWRRTAERIRRSGPLDGR